MGKIVLIIATTIFVFGALSINAQAYSFRVLANKGQNKVKKAGSSTTEALRTGSTLNVGDELIASSGAYIGLMHKSGKTLEVRTAGKKKVADLEGLVNTKATSISSRYANFLANKMNEKESPNYRKQLNATGAVSRTLTKGAVSRALGDDENIQILVPINAEQTKFIGDNVIITWESPENMEENSFIVTVSNIYDKEVMKQEVNGNALELNLNSKQLAYEKGAPNLYIVQVKAKENEEVSSGNIGIERLIGEDARKYSEGLTAIQSELSEESPLNKIIYASYFEENGLIIDALTQLTEAIEMNPEIEDFKDLRKDFIERNGIKIYK